MPRVAKKTSAKRGRPPLKTKAKRGRPPLSAKAKRGRPTVAAAKKKKPAASRRPKSKVTARAKAPRKAKRSAVTSLVTAENFERLVTAVERIAYGLEALIDEINVGDFIGDVSFSDGDTPPPTDQDISRFELRGASNSDLDDLATSATF